MKDRIDSKQIQDLREKEVARWLDGLVVEHSEFRVLEGPEGRQMIPKGFFQAFGFGRTFFHR